MVKKVIKASASWCAPCRMYKPIFESVSKLDAFKDIEFQEVDIENDNSLNEYGIRSIPTTLLLNVNNELIDRLTGLLSNQELIDFIEKNNG